MVFTKKYSLASPLQTKLGFQRRWWVKKNQNTSLPFEKTKGKVKEIFLSSIFLAKLLPSARNKILKRIF
jgi:hypothetical protein